MRLWNVNGCGIKNINSLWLWQFKWKYIVLTSRRAYFIWNINIPPRMMSLQVFLANVIEGICCKHNHVQWVNIKYQVWISIFGKINSEWGESIFPQLKIKSSATLTRLFILNIHMMIRLFAHLNLSQHNKTFVHVYIENTKNELIGCFHSHI